jgi:hypothetical protein
MNKLQTKILTAIKSVLLIHENQKDKTDKYAAEKCEAIVDTYACGFVDWLTRNDWEAIGTSGYWVNINTDEEKTIKELFNQFKDEY